MRAFPCIWMCVRVCVCACVSASCRREFLKMLQTNPEAKSWRKKPLPLEINYFQALIFWSQLLFSPKQSNCVDIELSMRKNRFELLEIQFNDCHSCYYMDNNVLSFSSKNVIFPSIRVFSNESVLRIKWPKYWSFSFSHQSFQWIFRTDFL